MPQTASRALFRYSNIVQRYRRFFATSLEGGQIPAFWNGDHNWLGTAFIAEVVLQLYPEYARLGANNIVFVRVVARKSTIDVDPDLLFCRFLGLVLEGATAYVQEKASKPWGLLKGIARGHALD